jgi:hypothetical protein
MREQLEDGKEKARLASAANEQLEVGLQDSLAFLYTTTIQNIPDWCRHLYSSCGSVKHQ